MLKKTRRKNIRRKKKTDRKQIYTFLFVILLLLVLYFLVNNRVNMPFRSKYKVSQVPAQNIDKSRTITEAIDHARILLGVPDNKYSINKKSNNISYTIGIDSNIMDLNFANSIITGQVEIVGGQVIKGLETNNSNRQILEYKDKADSISHTVNLYYTRYSQKDKSGQIKLAIVVDDFGYYEGELLEAFCSLDSNVTFAILPHLKYSRTVMNRAAATGHEIIIHMPMEPLNYPKIDPGPDAIYTHNSSGEIRKRVQGYLKNLPLCVGANNHMGSLATADRDVMNAVLSVLKKNGLYFVDSRTTQESIAYKMAMDMMIPAFENTLFLDTPTISGNTLQIKLDRLQKLSNSREKMLVISHCASSKHYEYLKKFIAEITKLNFQIVPVSALFQSELPEIL
ncbi:MAG: divergent polysaccharide deacetylase family protein [Candidatus Cloacimonetes bacterium]|nr:divergent polysaccharide deacetylase family protein [Candidatus Cloacimonadota bacterium]